MKRESVFTFLMFIALLCQAQQPEKPVHENKVNLFSLKDIRITNGQFKEIQELDHQYLLTLNPDKLMSWFHREAGLTPKAQPYPYWESDHFNGHGPLAGHILGFYLSSMSMMYQTTGDEKIIDRLKYTLAEMKKCQDAQGDGYLLATINGRQIFEDVIEDNFTTSNPFIHTPPNDRTWEPVYIMNKIMLGLYGVYTRCNLPEAKPILVKMADWFGYEVLDKLNHEQIQKLLVCEHGSINESYIDVYTITGDKKYLDWARQLNDEDMWVPAAEQRDILHGWHANTQIPKFTGFTRVYQYTDEDKFYRAARFFWNTVVNEHTWANGGNSTGEHFFPTNEFEKRITLTGGPESCNSINMMRLTEALYPFDQDIRKVDYYERILFNHVLANYDPEEGMCTYYTSMRPGHYRIYGTKYDSFWCCTGTGFEAPAKFGQMIYAYDDQSLYVNMFIPSTVNWQDKKINLVQDTRFPDEDRVVFTVQINSKTAFKLKIRSPYWVESSKTEIKVNGKKVKGTMEGDYFLIDNMWKNNDRIEFSFSPRIQVNPLKDSNKYASIEYGPIVLGTKIKTHVLPKSEFRHARKTVGDITMSTIETPPLIGSYKEITKQIKREKSDNLFLTYHAPKGSGENIELIPFNRIHFSRYALYFNHFDKKENETGKQALETIRKTKADNKLKLDQLTVDAVKIGDPESEQAHHMESINSNTGGYADESWRDAANGGYFMYNMKVIPNAPQSIYLVMRADDSGARIYDVLIEGKLVRTIDHSQPIKDTNAALHQIVISIPGELIQWKDNVTVKLHAKRRNTAGGIFGLRILRTIDESEVPNFFFSDPRTPLLPRGGVPVGRSGGARK